MHPFAVVRFIAEYTHTLHIMSDVPLAHKYSAETYDKALSNLVERWNQEGDGSPIKYDEAAIGMDKSTVSTALKFLGEIGLLEVPKAGSYIVPEDVLNYRTKMGAVRDQAKRDVAERLDDYPLYKEAKFMIGLDDFELDELAENVSGSASVAASQDELRDVNRSLNILIELGFLEVDEEGHVSVPDDLGGGAESAEEEVGPDIEEGQAAAEAETEADGAGTGAAARQATAGGAAVGPEIVTGLTVEMDISMDVTEMETQEVKDKLEVINKILGQNEE